MKNHLLPLIISTPSVLAPDLKSTLLTGKLEQRARSVTIQTLIVLRPAWWLAPVLLFLLVIIEPNKAFAEHYNQADADKISALAFARASGGLSSQAFESAVMAMIDPDDTGNSELTQKLVQHLVTKKGIDAVLRVFNKAVAKKSSQQQAATKAKAIEESHSKAVIAHTDAKVAANNAKLAHETAAKDPNNAAKAAEAVAKDQAVSQATQKSATADAALPLKGDAAPTNSMWTVLLWSGAKLENPYSITNGIVKPNNSKTDGFITLELKHRYVLASDSYGVDNLFYSWFQTERKFGDGTWDFFLPGQVFPDLEFRVGYVFSGTSTPTNLTVSTIAGGSDFYSDNSIGIPFWRWSSRDSWDQQATIELAGGFVTDKQFLDIHPNYFIGLGYQFHNKDWSWQNRFGLGAADVPRLREGSMVATNAMGLPLFDLKRAPSWGTEISYSLSPAVKIQLGANTYFDKRAVWNISAGISVEPVSLFSSFATKK